MDNMRSWRITNKMLELLRWDIIEFERERKFKGFFGRKSQMGPKKWLSGSWCLPPKFGGLILRRHIKVNEEN